MGLWDLLHELRSGKPRYSAEKRRLRDAETRQGRWVRHLATFAGVNASLLAINWLTSRYHSF